MKIALLFTIQLILMGPTYAFWSKLKSFFGVDSNPVGVQNSIKGTIPSNSKETNIIEQLINVLPKDDISLILSNARAAIYKNDFSDAVKLLLPIIDSDPDQIDANMLLGSSFLALDRSDLAEAFLHRSCQLTNWTIAAAVSNLAESLRLNGDVDLATKVLLKGYMAMNKTDSTGLIGFAFGVILEQQQKYSEAADWFLSSALAEPSNVEAWLRASTMLFPSTAWDLGFAENVLVQGVKVNPGSASLVFNLGVALHYSDRTNEAVALYAEVLRLDSLHYGAMSNLATAMHSLGRLEEARVLYEVIYNATSQSPADYGDLSGASVALGNYALLLNSQMRPGHALRIVRRALAIDKDSVDLEAIYQQSQQLFSDLQQRYENIRTNLVSAVHAGDWPRGLRVLEEVGEPAENEQAVWWHFAKGMLNYFR